MAASLHRAFITRLRLTAILELTHTLHAYDRLKPPRTTLVYTSKDMKGMYANRVCTAWEDRGTAIAVFKAVRFIYSAPYRSKDLHLLTRAVDRVDEAFEKVNQSMRQADADLAEHVRPTGTKRTKGGWSPPVVDMMKKHRQLRGVVDAKTPQAALKAADKINKTGKMAISLPTTPDNTTVVRS